MSSDVNRAVQANLEKVLADEQRNAALRMAWVRFWAVTLGMVMIWVPLILGLIPNLDPDKLRPTSYGVVVYWLLAVALLVATRSVPRLGKWAALAVALVDVPVLSFIQHAQQARLPAMWMGIPTNVAMMCGLVTLSVLSLSRTVLFVTAAAALASIEATLWRTGTMPIMPMLLTGMVPLFIGFIGATVVGRVRALVHEARKKDLVGKYILGERLGAGGMAEVFLATYSPEGGFERKVAVKRILPSFAQSTESVALFRREAELGAMLAHPNIVQVLDFGTDGTTYFLAMEHIDGISLSRLLTYCRQANRPLPMPAVVYVAWMLGDAVDYIHSRTTPTGTELKLIHRDLNPPNVLVSQIGEVKLGDFGIARAATQEQLTAAGILRGKVGYSAPEQLLDLPYDSRADLFSLGVTLFEVVTSRRLFIGDSDVALFKACIEAPILPPSTIRPDVPPALDAVVMRLLERDVARRTQSAREVVEQLRALPPELTDHATGRRLLADLVAAARLTLPDSVAPTLPTPQNPDEPTASVAVLPGSSSGT